MVNVVGTPLLHAVGVPIKVNVTLVIFLMVPCKYIVSVCRHCFSSYCFCCYREIMFSTYVFTERNSFEQPK